MSHAYQMRLEVRGLSLRQVRRMMIRSGWAEEYGEVRTDERRQPYVAWGGSGALYGRQTEGQAHERLAAAFRRINPICRVRTCWLYVEYLWEDAEVFGSLDDEIS